MQTPVNLLASLFTQLSQARNSLSNDAKELYHDHLDYGTRPKLSEISALLQSEITRFSKIFVILDALDECSGEGPRTSFFSELQCLQPKVNLLVTSRFFDTIARKFEGKRQLEVVASDQDVRKYVSGRISREDRLLRHIQKDAALLEHITETIVQNAESM